MTSGSITYDDLLVTIEKCQKVEPKYGIVSPEFLHTIKGIAKKQNETIAFGLVRVSGIPTYTDIRAGDRAIMVNKTWLDLYFEYPDVFWHVIENMKEAQQ